MDRNIFKMTEEQRLEAGIDSLPGDLMEAIGEMEKSDFVRETLGDHVFRKYIKAKKKEWNQYRTSVSKWEIDNYLTKY